MNPAGIDMKEYKCGCGETWWMSCDIHYEPVCLACGWDTKVVVPTGLKTHIRFVDVEEYEVQPIDN